MRGRLRHQVALVVMGAVAAGGNWAAPLAVELHATYRPNGVTRAPEAVATAGVVPIPAAGGAVLGASTRAGGGAASREVYGLATSVARIPAGQLDAELSNMKALGVGWVRFDLEWDNIEAAQGQFNWADYDRAVSAVAAHGLQSLAILDYTPAWARLGACADSPMCAPANAADFGAFAGAAVARYKANVHTWEIWNEPNTANFFGPGANAGGYVGLLKSADGAIKQIQPGATVLTAGLAPAASGGGDLAPVDFVNGMYAAGAKGYFDGLGDHPYTYPAGAGTRPGDAWGQMAAIHGIMAAHGDGAKKVWITEYGAPTGGPGGSNDVVSEAAQAAMVTAAVRAAAGLSFVGAFFWYTYGDAGTSTDTEENFFGLVRADGSHKSAYAAYAAAIAGR